MGIPASPAQADPPAKVDKVKPDRARTLPDSWAPSRSTASTDAEVKARSRGIDLDLELEKLRDWARGGNHKRVDWDAVWRNWTRTAKPTNGHSYQPNSSPTQVALEELERIRREERQRKESA